MNSGEIIKMAETEAKNIRGADFDLFGIVKQVCEITGSSHDMAATALFDCNYDVERAVDKIFEKGNEDTFEEKRNDVWKEVAKVKRKVASGDLLIEETKNDIKIGEELRGRGGLRGSNRGRSRGGRVGDAPVRGSFRGRGRRPQTLRSRVKPRDQDEYQSYGDDNYANEVGNHGGEWIMDDFEPIIYNCTEYVEPLSKLTLSEDNPVDIVAKYSNKDGVFGDFSRTKAPPRSSILPTAPIKIVTATGVMSLPSTAFNFGLDISEYCSSGVELKNNKKVADEINDTKMKDEDYNGKRISGNDDSYRIVAVGHDDVKRVQESPKDIRRVQESPDDIRRVQGSQNDTRNLLSEAEYHRSHNTHHDNDIHTSVSPITSFSSSLPTHNLSDSNDATFPAMMPSHQLCPPPGMSNAHILQQIPNPQYLSLMNLPNGQSIFDALVSSSNDNPQLIHSLDSKDFLSKTIKTNDHEHSTVLNAMQMPNLCCFPQVYMNNYTSFLPTVPNHNSQTAESSQQQPSSTNNPSMLAMSSSSSHRSYVHDDFTTDAGKYDDVVTASKHKYVRQPNYGPNYTGAVIKDDGQHDKNNRQPMGPTVNRSGQQQQTVNNDPRFLAFHHQTHQYPNNIYNCVTAPGTHSSGPHPYAMPHQAGGLPQLHLMQQHMHNFPPSYQFQDHLMTSMVPNTNNRNNGGTNGNQSARNNRTTSLWHPSN